MKGEKWPHFSGEINGLVNYSRPIGASLSKPPTQSDQASVNDFEGTK